RSALKHSIVSEIQGWNKMLLDLVLATIKPFKHNPHAMPSFQVRFKQVMSELKFFVGDPCTLVRLLFDNAPEGEEREDHDHRPYGKGKKNSLTALKPSTKRSTESEDNITSDEELGNEESEEGDGSERIDGRITDDSEDDALETMSGLDTTLGLGRLDTTFAEELDIVLSSEPVNNTFMWEETRDGSMGFHEVDPTTNTTKEGNQPNPFGMDIDALDEDLQFLQQLEGQYHIMAPPSALLSASSVKGALVIVGNFLSQAMGLVTTGDSSWPHQAFDILSHLELHLLLPGGSVEQMLSMHTASESINAWMEAIERSKKLQDTANHEKSTMTSTSTTIQGKVAKSKAMSLHVSTSQKEKAVRTSKIAELETELQRLRAEEAEENSKTDTLTHNLKTMMAEVRVLVEKEKALPPNEGNCIPTC
ncbi:hypothetical protein LINGRAHAP2_LOCUS30557, partial [Linum grandiflorum]